MNWSNEWKDDLKKAMKPVLDSIPNNSYGEIELTLSDDQDQQYKVKAIIVGNLAVHSDRAGWSYTVSHVPTMTKFRLAVPHSEHGDQHSKQALINWCGKVQQEFKDDWTALRSLTASNYHDLPEVRLRIMDWCLSVEVQ